MRQLNKAVLLTGVAMKFLNYDNDGWNDTLQLNGLAIDQIIAVKEGAGVVPRQFPQFPKTPSPK